MKKILESFDSRRLVMEPRQKYHVREMFDDLQEEEIYTYISRDLPSDPESLEARFEELYQKEQFPRGEIWLGWVARLKETRECVGIFELSISQEGEALVAYTLFKRFWGRSLAKEASLAMIKNALKNYPIKKFIIELDTRNRRSLALAESLGFKILKVKNNACFLKGMVSHEFYMELNPGENLALAEAP